MEIIFSFSGISYPVTLNGITKFEHQNNIGINVFRIDGNGNILPIRTTTMQNASRIVRLLQISNEETSHYVLITDFSKFVRSQISKCKKQHYFCDYCLHGCTTAKILEKHVDRCRRFKAQNVFVPEVNDPKGRDKLTFTQTEHQLPLPFVIYADFESILEPVNTVLPNPLKPSTTVYQRHVPCGAAYKIVSTDPKYNHEPVVFTGPDSAEKFLDQLQIDVKQIRSYLKNKQPMLLTAEEEEAYKSTTSCHICSMEFTDFGEGSSPKVRDHDHLTGQFRG